MNESEKNESEKEPAPDDAAETKEPEQEPAPEKNEPEQEPTPEGTEPQQRVEDRIMNAAPRKPREPQLQAVGASRRWWERWRR